MKLSRAFAAFLPSSSSQARKCLLLRAATALQAASLSTGSNSKPAPRKGTRTDGHNPAGAESTSQLGPPKEAEYNGSSLRAPTMVGEEAASQLPKPREIPWQAKVANTVHLIGHMGTPVQLGVSPDGAYTAVSVLLHEKTHDLPQFWIPIVFQGDLAQIAACNLKEKDHVYVNGQLTGGSQLIDSNPDTKIQEKDHVYVNGQLTGGSQLIDSNPDTKIQVMVHSISYVLDLHPQNHFRNNKGLVNTSAQVKDTPFVVQLWNDLFANPHKWWDYRQKDNKRSGMFKHKDSGQLLEINEDTPEWILSQLDKLIFTSSTSSTSSVNFQSAIAKKAGELVAHCWNDLIENPQSWWDNREDKRNGKITQRHPDFGNKVTRQGLWLNSAPDWVLPKLKSLEVSGETSRQEEAKQISTRPATKEESWRNLVENPDKWWDNRSNKSKPNAPDFKHKETGEGLWLHSATTPKWVLDKLPPTNNAKDQ